MTLLSLTNALRPLTDQPVQAAAPPAQRAAIEALPQPEVFAAPDVAATALSGVARGDRDAVVWLSEHIAALDRVIYPAAARHLKETSELRAQQAATHRLALLVRRLHAQLDGDGGVAREDVTALRRAVLAAVGEHSLTERQLLTRLREALTADRWTELTAQYVERLQHGPTRPHPHAPRSGLAGRLAYRLTSWTDHVLDVLDSRSVRALPVTSQPDARTA